LSAPPRVSALAPFRVRSYRFQWPADLATSWAFEMEALILGWYVLVETGSVLWLTVFASLQYTGTLLAPVFGVVGHRIGTKKLICAMRATYFTLAAVLMTLAFTGVLAPVYVFINATLLGLIRPSDLVMRYALIGETLPATQLVGATSVSRTTQDSARIAGALTGAGVVATLGIGPAYVVVASLYATSFLLTLQVASARPGRLSHPDSGGAPAHSHSGSSAWRDLKDGVAVVWSTPQILAAMCLAFLVNVTAFPLVNALLPYVAREIYRTDQTGLGYLVASWAFGALLGSITLSRIGYAIRPARTMLVACATWYAMILVFAQMNTAASGSVVLMLAGFAQSLGMISMSAMLLRTAGDRFRSRVMGIRMMAVYGLPIGLLLSGPLITHFGYPATATLYCIAGLAVTLLIAARWRAHLWRPDAAANTR
jgi:predicted MFS family arabinose efflux permease